MTKRLLSTLVAVLIALLPSVVAADSLIISRETGEVEVELHCGSIIESMELDQGKQMKLDSSMLAQKCRMAVVGSHQGFIGITDNAVYQVENSELVRIR